MARKKAAPKPRRVPQRTCIACRQANGKRALVRLVRTADGVDVDPTGKKAGRGAYLCSSRDCWTKAIETNRIASALRTSVSKADLQKLSDFMETQLLEEAFHMDTMTMENHV